MTIAHRPDAPPIKASAEPVSIVCRRMRDDDMAAAIALLERGFPERSAAYWRRALGRQRDRPLPETYPRYGYVMTDAGRLVGIILVIFARSDCGQVRGNVSSWYVDPHYRPYSGMLVAAPMRLKGVTLFNISPSPGTIETIIAQGFSRYVDGTFHALAALSPRVRGVKIRTIRADTPNASALLRDHAALGCMVFEVTQGHETYPFVFVRSRSFNYRVPSAQLVYCRDVADFVRFAGPLGRRLALNGLPSVMLDAKGRLAGLIGCYFTGKRLKFFRGESAPRLCDLSYSELALFGP